MIHSLFQKLRQIRIRMSRPKILTVEPTNNCNLNCSFCLTGLQGLLTSTQHRLLPRELGFIDFRLFEKITAEAVSFGIEALQLHFQGEPLLHPRLADMVKAAKD